MEDYWDIIIYGVLAIIGLISSGLNKRKKEQNASKNFNIPFEEETSFTDEQENRTPFPEFLDKLLTDSETETYIEEEKTEDKIEKPADIEPNMEPENEPVPKEFNPIYDNEICEGPDDQNFDLEQAVIYSTILKTKHF